MISPIKFINSIFNNKNENNSEIRHVYETKPDSFERQTTSKREVQPLIIRYGSPQLTIKEHYKNHVARISELSDEQKILTGDKYRSEETNKNNLITSDKGYIDGITSGFALLLYNDEQGTLMNIEPEVIDDFDKTVQMHEFIKEEINKLSHGEKNQCKAFIFGGDKNESEVLFDEIQIPITEKSIPIASVAFAVNPYYDKSLYFDIPSKSIMIDEGYYNDYSELNYFYQLVKSENF